MALDGAFVLCAGSTHARLRLPDGGFEVNALGIQSAQLGEEVRHGL
jgi:hypothetical protein